MMELTPVNAIKYQINLQGKSPSYSANPRLIHTLQQRCKIYGLFERYEDCYFDILNIKKIESSWRTIPPKYEENI